MSRAILASLVGGLAAGALDIIYAFLAFGPLSFDVAPERILQSVAAGAIGRDAAVAGGWTTALLGLALHFAIAIVMAAVFVALAGRLRVLTDRAVLAGIAYGLFLFFAMNHVVVPLSAAGDNGAFASNFAEAGARLSESFSAFQPRIRTGYEWMYAGSIFAHTILVGVPIALAAKRFAQSA